MERSFLPYSLFRFVGGMEGDDARALFNRVYDNRIRSRGNVCRERNTAGF